MFNFKSFLANLSQQPGVYQMLGEQGEILYIGKARNLKKRVASYFNAKTNDPKTQALVQHIHTIEVIVTHSENEAVLLECTLIKKHRPRYNILLRDDKSYPYIVMTTQHVFPRIDFYRGPRKKKGACFGPYPSVLAVRETISLLQKIFHLRTCADSYYNARTRPCLLYQVGRCSGPCVKLITQADYAQNVQLAMLFLQGKSKVVVTLLQEKMEAASTALNFELAAEYRDQISRLRQLQARQYVNVATGHADILGLAVQAGMACVQLLAIRSGQLLGSRAYFPSVLANSTASDIMSAFITQHYLNHPAHTEDIPKEILTGSTPSDQDWIEQVLSSQSGRKVELHQPRRGDKLKWLEMAEQNAKQSLAARLFTRSTIEERMLALQQALSLAHLPARIECYDISHSMGEAAVGSCVVFNREGPIKSEYRRFNIKDITPGDDVAAMRQVVMRRFERLQKEAAAALPDVVLVDGGLPQLQAANDVMVTLKLEEITLIGVSKGPGRKPGFETLHRLSHAPWHLPGDSMALHFIQQIRDEAHRFAITGHRLRRDKTRRVSVLQDIPGIGAKRRRELLRYFGGIQGIAHASLGELLKVPGINRSLAERIFVSLHDTNS